MTMPDQGGYSTDYAEDMYEQTALNETEHISGNKNNVFTGLRRMSPGTYQWLIVAAAVGVLLALHGSFKGTFKKVL